MPGRALEIGLATADIRRSFEFWTQLGFGSALTTDTWSHPYGVLTAPHISLGLHSAELPSPLITLVRPDIAGLVPLLEERGVEPEHLRLGTEVFNELQFVDPSGLRVRVLEARTFSPPPQPAPPLLGQFEALSWPCTDPEAVTAFWERLHVDCAAAEDWSLLRGDIGGFPVAWHSPRVAREPLLVFRHAGLPKLAERLAAAGVTSKARALGFPHAHLLVTSPEGQQLAILA
jgi:hypothetical protein